MLPFNTAFMTRRILRIMRSHDPPWCDALGVLKIYSMCRCVRFCITLRYHSSKLVFMSLCAPLKFVPLSQRMRSGFPLLATNLINPFINASDSRECNISIWTARVAKHVKMQPYLFSTERARLTKRICLNLSEALKSSRIYVDLYGSMWIRTKLHDTC